MPNILDTFEASWKVQNPNVVPVDYSKEEMEYWNFLVRRLSQARNQRDTNHMEFDSLDYISNYETNQRAANSYIEPKKNRMDTRIVTGTTREKENTLISALLNYNLDPSFDAYDMEDYVIEELGTTIGDLVKKSRELEAYDDKRKVIYREYLDQGTVFVEDVWVERFCIEKDVKMDWTKGVSISKTNWKKRLGKVYKGAEARLIPGTKVYLGNIKANFIKDQPYIYTYETVSYEDARSIYGQWERWKNVPRTIMHISDTITNYVDYRNWSLFEIQNDTVEIIKYQDKFNNELMITLNGVMMLPVGFPLQAVSPSGEYTIAQSNVEDLAFFAYGKSIPAKTKVPQQVLDEYIKLIVLKTQQSFEPPMANNTGRALSNQIFWPGKITQDVDPTKIAPMFDAKGVSQAEFSAFQLIKQIVDEESVSPVFSGDYLKGNQTATQILEMKKQQMMKLGLTIWGVISLERQLAWLRAYNLLQNWTSPIDERINDVTGKIEKQYRTISVKTNLENGREGRRIIKMNPQMANQMSSDQVMAEENFLSQSIPTRVTYLNPEAIREVKMWLFCTVIPTEKNTSTLERVLFTQNIRDAAAIFGPQSLNMDGLKERFAILAHENPDKFFLKAGAQMMNAAQPGQGGPEMMKMAQQQGGATGGSITSGLTTPPTQFSGISTQ